MMCIAPPLALLMATLALAQPAQAAGTLTRTFVSSAGSNSNPCTITAPCASFATAYAAVVPNGIIAALDPGRYGPVTITGPVTINGYGWAAITAPAAGNGITITAGAADKVTLTGLNIDGAAAAYNGIVANSVGSLTISNCVLQNFVDNATSGTGDGILMLPASGPVTFTITNTTVANNTQAGISYFPQGGSFNVDGVIDHVVAAANKYGIYIATTFVTGGTTAVAISNSIVSANVAGIDLPSTVPAPLKLSIDNVSVSGHSGTGIAAGSTANVLLGRSVITGNAVGVFNNTSPNTFYTYQNNQIDLNTTDVGGTALNTTKPLR
jgi:Right handed beta helix region